MICANWGRIQSCSGSKKGDQVILWYKTLYCKSIYKLWLNVELDATAILEYHTRSAMLSRKTGGDVIYLKYHKTSMVPLIAVPTTWFLGNITSVYVISYPRWCNFNGRKGKGGHRFLVKHIWESCYKQGLFSLAPLCSQAVSNSFSNLEMKTTV